MLTNTQILALLQLPNLGRKSIIAMAEYARIAQKSIKGVAELHDFIAECKERKLVRGAGQYLDTEVNTAYAFAVKIEEAAESADIQITSYYDKNYPEKLRHLKKDGKNDSPALIFSKGNLKIVDEMPSVAIIGTRTPSIGGSIGSTHIAEEFAKEGFNIVSGLALGCDTAAHQGALNAGGKTTAILAHGLDTVYPPENKALLQKIIDNGGLAISEYPMGVRPQQIYFVERDRLQAGISDATIVVEATSSSGARHAVNTAVNNQKATYYTELSTDFASQEEGCLFAEGPSLLTEDNLQSIITQLKDLFSQQ